MATAAEEYGYHMGLAFQIVDDILDIVGAADVSSVSWVRFLGLLLCVLCPVPVFVFVVQFMMIPGGVFIRFFFLQNTSAVNITDCKFFVFVFPFTFRDV